MTNGKPLLAIVGLVLAAAGVVALLLGNAAAGVVLLIVGVFVLVLAVHDWDEFTAEAKDLKLSITRSSSQTGPVSVEATPREPELEILSIEARGGHAAAVDFVVEVTNRGTKSCRAKLEADVDGWPVTCRPSTLDLGPDSGVMSFDVLVARPALGNLVGAFNHATTLYGRTLNVRLSADGHQVEDSWREIVYDNASNAARREIQQGVWHDGADLHPEPLEIGIDHTRFCRTCDTVTNQRLMRLLRDGAGRPINRDWQCLLHGGSPE